VHFTGRLCDMTAIARIAQEHDLLIVEDAAQAMGAQRGTYRAGSVGDAAAFSLNPMKVFPGYGEAGAVVTDDAAIDERLRNLRYLGTERKEVCAEIALNHKMDEIQAAMLLHGFDVIEDLVESRVAMARCYSERMLGIVGCPPVPPLGDCSSNFFDYVIFTQDRDGLRHFLHTQGIETKVKHPVLLCDHPAYPCKPRPQIPVADRLASQMISLPLHEKMDATDIDYVCDAIRRYCHGG
jgi:dTDP-4-amino-4,6-dideoxygalactose transaminase